MVTTHPANRKYSKSLDKNIAPEFDRLSGKSARLARVRRMIARYLPDFVHDTTSVQYVERDNVALMLHLTQSFKYDARADHVLQQLISLGIIPRCNRVDGKRVFDRDALVQALQLWVGQHA